MLIGTTLSHRHASYLKLDPILALEQLVSMGFDSIRLGCYWNESELQKGTYDFSIITTLLELCEKHGQNVILSLGMKAPRYPEYYFPQWLVDKNPKSAEVYIIPYLYKAVETLRKFSAITHWQVENEPLDPSGPKNLSIPVDLLQKEIDVVREKDSRPVIVSVWGNELKKRQLLLQVKNRVDVIGLDLYYKVPVFGPVYRGPQENDEALKKMIKQLGKPVYITELQAEPWERNILLTKSDKTPSMNPDLLKENINRASSLSPAALYLWGAEYWLWKQKQGDTTYIEVVNDLLKR